MRPGTGLAVVYLYVFGFVACFDVIGRWLIRVPANNSANKTDQSRSVQREATMTLYLINSAQNGRALLVELTQQKQRPGACKRSGSKMWQKSFCVSCLYSVKHVEWHLLHKKGHTDKVLIERGRGAADGCFVDPPHRKKNRSALMSVENEPRYNKICPFEGPVVS